MGRASRKRAELRASARALPAPLDVPVVRRRLLTYAQEQAVRRLIELVDSRRQLDRDIDDLVTQLVALGATYGEIGRALGISRQATRQRYGA